MVVTIIEINLEKDFMTIKNDDKKEKVQSASSIVGMWMCFGVAIGVALDNIVLGSIIGVVIGLAHSKYQKSQNDKGNSKK